MRITVDAERYARMLSILFFIFTPLPLLFLFLRWVYFNILITFCGDKCNYSLVFGENSILVQLLEILLHIRVFGLLGIVLIKYERLTDTSEICTAQGHGRAV